MKAIFCPAVDAKFGAGFKAMELDVAGITATVQPFKPPIARLAAVC